MVRTLLWAVPIGIAMAEPAQAHLMNSGFGPFYDGLAHPFMTPGDLLPVLAISLLAGLRGARCGRRVIFLLPTAWLAGMTGGTMGLAPLPLWLTCIITMALGAMVAADRPWPEPLVPGLALLAGTIHGYGNGLELTGTGGGATAMAGIICALFVVSALIAGQVAAAGKRLGRIAVRMTGSWIAAIGMLMFGWSIR